MIAFSSTAPERPRGFRPFRWFHQWLREQRHRQDPIGDLARDVRDDDRPCGFRSLAEWVDHIGGSHSIAYATLVAAWRAFARVAVSAPHERRDRRPHMRDWTPEEEALVLAATMAGDWPALDALRARREPDWKAPRRGITPRVRTRIMERDGFRCRRCGNEPRHARLVVDHILPVARGGSDDDANLQTLCEPCNQGKRDRAPHAHDLEVRA